jgi:outer membrane protein assembly factor BamA
MEHAFSISYKALFPRPVMHSDLILYANYDAIRWIYYFGLGNDTKFSEDHNRQYYTMRTRQWIFQPQLTRKFGKSTVSAYLQAQGIRIIDDTSRFISKSSVNTTGFNWETYVGAGISYSYQKLNDPVVPTKGYYLSASTSGEQNLKTSSSHYLKLSGVAHLYVPLVSKFSLNLRAGAATVAGNPEFYQYPSIGGIFFRGVVRDRFRGKTALYNTNDLRFISPVHTYLFNGKAGFLVFVDDGRVWMPEEKSDTWHVAYGGGVILAPFNFAYADATYGLSKKEHTIQVRVNFLINP